MILHTVNQSFYTHTCLYECLELCAKQASVLLIENGVYAATSQLKASLLINDHPHINFYALKADLVARGLIKHLNPTITLVDDHGFVDLCVSHDTVQSWY